MRGQVHGEIHEASGTADDGLDVDKVRMHVCGQEPTPTVARGNEVDGDICNGHSSGLGNCCLECCLDPANVVVEVGLGLVERDSGRDLLRVSTLVSLEAAAVEQTAAVLDRAGVGRADNGDVGLLRAVVVCRAVVAVRDGASARDVPVGSRRAVSRGDCGQDGAVLGVFAREAL